MGMYTQIFVNVDLKENTPVQILNMLRSMAKKAEITDIGGIPQRWNYMFRSKSSYFAGTTFCTFQEQDNFNKNYSFTGLGDIKNYGNEIGEFFELIAPYVCDNVMGHWWYEEDEEPTIALKEDYIVIAGAGRCRG